LNQLLSMTKIISPFGVGWGFTFQFCQCTLTYFFENDFLLPTFEHAEIE